MQREAQKGDPEQERLKLMNSLNLPHPVVAHKDVFRQQFKIQPELWK
jgi:hypothetical protein